MTKTQLPAKQIIYKKLQLQSVSDFFKSVHPCFLLFQFGQNDFKVVLGHVFIYHRDLFPFLENTGTLISISRKNRMSLIILLYQSFIITQLTRKEDLNIQNHNHYIICTRSFTPPVNCLSLVSPPFLLASHLVIVYKLLRLKGLVLTQKH